MAPQTLENPPEPYGEEPAHIRLDLGCGPHPREGFEGVDQYAFDGKVKHVLDLTQFPWPWEDGSVSQINASHFMEHFGPEDRTAIVNECYRILKPFGRFEIVCPNWSSQRAYGDPTHCFAEDTEILTEHGWKLISLVEVGEKALTMDFDESPVFSEVQKVIVEPFNGKMLHFKTARMDLMVTPNHDLLWRSKPNKGYDNTPIRKSPASDFVKLSGHHPRRAISVIKSWYAIAECPERLTIPKQQEHHGTQTPLDFDASDFAAFMGWLVSEGHVDLSSQGHYRVVLAQSPEANPDKCWEIHQLLTRMGFTFTESKDRITINSKHLAMYLQPLGLQPVRYIPEAIKALAPCLLKVFIDAAVKGDGRKNGVSREYMTTSKRLADDMQEVCLKAGFRASVGIEKRSGKLTYVNESSKPSEQLDMYVVGICDPTHAWYPRPIEVAYTGQQVCVSVADNHNILVRRNGRAIWAGNCWPPVTAF